MKLDPDLMYVARRWKDLPSLVSRHKAIVRYELGRGDWERKAIGILSVTAGMFACIVIAVPVIATSCAKPQVTAPAFRSYHQAPPQGDVVGSMTIDTVCRPVLENINKFFDDADGANKFSASVLGSVAPVKDGWNVNYNTFINRCE